MAVLTDEQRREMWAEFMRELSADRNPCAITKADLRAAFDALDDWMHANAATINAAIPQPARAGLTAPQKARLLAAVLHKRYSAGA
jgi:hypothetical protein